MHQPNDDVDNKNQNCNISADSDKNTDHFTGLINLPIDQINNQTNTNNIADLLNNRINKNKKLFYSIEISSTANLQLNFNDFSVQPLFTSITWFAFDGNDSTSGNGVNLQSISKAAESSIHLANCITSTPVLSHITCSNLLDNNLIEILLNDKISRNLFVLRGDLVNPKQSYQYAADLVKRIRQLSTSSSERMSIGVAGYPETHPAAIDPETDLTYLKNKILAGADFIITQLCFNYQIIEKFIKNCRLININVPIIIGIFIPHSMTSLKRMCKICCVRMPNEDFHQFQMVENNLDDFQKLSLEKSKNLINKLKPNEQIKGVQIFTLNKFDLVKEFISPIGHFKLAHQFWFSYPPPGAGGSSSNKNSAQTDEEKQRERQRNEREQKNAELEAQNLKRERDAREARQLGREIRAQERHYQAESKKQKEAAERASQIHTQFSQQTYKGSSSERTSSASTPPTKSPRDSVERNIPIAIAAIAATTSSSGGGGGGGSGSGGITGGGGSSSEHKDRSSDHTTTTTSDSNKNDSFGTSSKEHHTSTTTSPQTLTGTPSSHHSQPSHQHHQNSHQQINFPQQNQQHHNQNQHHHPHHHPHQYHQSNVTSPPSGGSSIGGVGGGGIALAGGQPIPFAVAALATVAPIIPLTIGTIRDDSTESDQSLTYSQSQSDALHRFMCRAPIASLDCMEEFSGTAGHLDFGRSLSLGSNPAIPIRHGSTPTPGLRYKNLGKSGLRISNVGLGTWPVFSPGVPEEQSEAILKLAIESGINLFDISEAHSEIELGKIIARSGWKRSSYVITTKIYWSTKSDERGLSRKHIIESVRASLQRLQLSYIDIVIIYKADAMCPMEEIVRAMTYVISQGWAMYWGTSRWSQVEIMEAYTNCRQFNCITPIVEQAEYHMFCREKCELYLPEMYNKIGVGLMAWGPLSMALGEAQNGERLLFPKGSFKTKSHSYSWTEDEVNRNEFGWTKEKAVEIKKQNDRVRDLQSLAEKLGCSPTQLSIAWSLKHEPVQCLLLGATSAEQLHQSLQALQLLPRLSTGVMLELERILENKPIRPPAISTLALR